MILVMLSYEDFILHKTLLLFFFFNKKLVIPYSLGTLIFDNKISKNPLHIIMSIATTQAK
jgi:hypothetical protein